MCIYGHDLDTATAMAKSELGLVPQEFNFSQFETCLDIVLNLGIIGVADVDVRIAIAILVVLSVALTALAQQMLAHGARIKS